MDIHSTGNEKKSVDSATVHNWSGKAGGFEFENAVYKQEGGRRTITGTPKGGQSDVTVTEAWNQEEKKWQTSVLTQQGGATLSGNAVVEELDKGNLSTLSHVMTGSAQEKREYANAVATEAAKVGQDLHVHSKEMGTNVSGTYALHAASSVGGSFGAGVPGVGPSARAAGELGQKAQVAATAQGSHAERNQVSTKRLAAGIEKALNSSSSPQEAASKIQTLRNNFNKEVSSALGGQKPSFEELKDRAAAMKSTVQKNASDFIGKANIASNIPKN